MTASTAAHSQNDAKTSICAAPAKVNLYLEILGRRADGFHELESVFQTLELHDTVTVTVSAAATTGITLACDDLSLPVDAGNLAWRAAAAYAAVQPLGQIAIELSKRVPSGAGLGGGSSDAAAVLRALNRLAPIPLPSATLAAMAAELGSDVPFFLIGGSALAHGRGERLTALADLPRRAVTVLMPDASLPTPAVYRELTDAERGPRAALGATELLARLAAEGEPPLHNRLTAPACRLCAPVAELLAWLRAQPVPHLMSGSGAACVALAHIAPPPGVRAWPTWYRARARLDALT